MDKFDLIVIGSGPGGYVAAIRAAQLGLKVACIDKEKTFGGTCLNVGCIPSKALLHSSENYDRWLKHGAEHGIESTELRVNLSVMMKRKEQIVKKLTDGVAYLFKKNRVTTFVGKASFKSGNEIVITSESGEIVIHGEKILLATGSEPIALPFLPFDEKIVLSSTSALSLPAIPKKLILVGAGVIGMELGSVYQRLGTEVTVIELMDRVCPTLDLEISKNLLSIFQKQGMKIHLSMQVTQGKKTESGIAITAKNAKGEEAVFEAEHALIAIGRKPYSAGLNLEKVGIKLDDKGRVAIDAGFRTSLPHVYAIGDLVEGVMLAHKASEEGIVVVESFVGNSKGINYLAIPNVMYTWPEVACVGMTEQEAKDSGLEVVIGKFPFTANARARCSGDEQGFVKIVGDKKTDRILGMHIIGPNASEMIGEGVLAIGQKMTLHELAHASHAHPTCSEAIKEAALGAIGPTLHL